MVRNVLINSWVNLKILSNSTQLLNLSNSTPIQLTVLHFGHKIIMKIFVNCSALLWYPSNLSFKYTIPKVWHDLFLEKTYGGS